MPHYYFLDHSKLMSSGQSESSDQHPGAQLQFQCSSEILNGNFFLLGQSIWIICQLLGEKNDRSKRNDDDEEVFLQLKNYYRELISIPFDVVWRHPIGQNPILDIHRFKSNDEKNEFFQLFSLCLGFVTLSIRTNDYEIIDQSVAQCEKTNRSSSNKKT